MPHYTHTHFINIDFLSNHTPTEFHFSCDSLQSVFSAYNSSVITLQMLTLDLCQSAGTVRKPTVLKRPWPQKHERGEGGVNTCEWEIGRPREREREDRVIEEDRQRKSGKTERVAHVGLSVDSLASPQGKTAAACLWSVLADARPNGIVLQIKGLCWGKEEGRGSGPGRAVLKPACNSSGTC